MLVTEAYNVRIQMGLLISQKSQQRREMMGLRTPHSVLGRIGTWIQGHWLQMGLFTPLHFISLHCSRLAHHSFIQLLLLLWSTPQIHLWVWNTCSLACVSPMDGYVSSMGKAQVCYFSTSQEQGSVQICPRLSFTKPLLGKLPRVVEHLAGVSIKDSAQFPGKYHCTRLPANSRPLQQ